MKRFLSLFVAILMMTSVGLAQAKKQNKTVQQTTATPLKKDGTPDKRFKENKKTAPTVVLKKDGTPDKRYKAKPAKKS